MSYQQPPGYPPQGYGPPPQGYPPAPPGYGGPQGYGPPPPPPPKKMGALTIGAIGCGGIFALAALCGIIGAISGPSSTKQAATKEPAPGADPQRAIERPSVSERRVSPPAPPAPPSFIKESCLDVATKFGAQSKLSDLQKDDLWPKYKGQAFKWKLQVTEVSSDMFGGFSVQFKCAPQSPSLIQDIQIKYPDSAKSVVIQMQKGATYEVQGKLTGTNTILGLMGDAL